MKKVFLTQIKTKDNVILEGIYVEPKRKTKNAVIWLHGLGSSFSYGQELMKELSSALQLMGIGYFKFNTRGHDVVTGFEKPYYGSAFEKFEESIFDIGSMIRFAHRLGYTRIILAGHSTGSNKIVYYLHKKRDRRVKGIILLAPICDNLHGEMIFGKKFLKKGLAIARKLKRKKTLSLMPPAYGILTAKRFWSLYSRGRAEDVFPYYSSSGWEELKSIKPPIAVIFGSKDKLLTSPAEEVIDIFRANAILTKSFKGIVIKKAVHGFQKKEKKMTRIITTWIKELRLKNDT